MTEAVLNYYGKGVIGRVGKVSTKAAIEPVNSQHSIHWYLLTCNWGLLNGSTSRNGLFIYPPITLKTGTNGNSNGPSG